MIIKKYMFGFTLAEILIALGIIGVVAVLVLKPLISNYQKMQFVAQFKEGYSLLNSAANSLKSDFGGDLSLAFKGTDDVTALDLICTKLACVKNCGTGTGCWYNVDIPYKYFPGTDMVTPPDTNITYTKAVLSNGMLLAINMFQVNFAYDPWANDDYDKLINNIGIFGLIDVNGLTGPNEAGRDVFVFQITKDGIGPTIYKDTTFHCNSTTNERHSCTYKLLLEGAMNY